MIFTKPGSWTTKTRAVKHTWSRHCHRRHFFYSLTLDNSSDLVRDPDSVPLSVHEGRHHLTGKTMAALRYSFSLYGDTVDWYLKADDDTYIIWSNLVRILSRYDAADRRYVGGTIRGTVKDLPQGYNAGGAAYALSRVAVRSLVEEGLKYPSECKKDGAIEDMDVGRCLQRLGVLPEDTLDSSGRARFHKDSPLVFFAGGSSRYFWVTQDYFVNYNGVEFGNPQKNVSHVSGRILSQESVSFHYITPAEMYFIDFLVEQLQH